jgi:hypothetical protein
VLATGQDKVDPTGTALDGIAPNTKLAAANLVVPVTSQRELTQLFGTPTFDVTEGSETSEYGLLAAYSYLGQGNRAYVVRADINTTELIPTATAPTGPVAAAQYWIDTNASTFGIHERVTGGWALMAPTVEVNLAATAGQLLNPATYTPATAVTVGGYLVTVLSNGSTSVEVSYWVGLLGGWSLLNAASAMAVTYAPHYSVPAAPTNGDVWIKVTQPGNGLNLVAYQSDAAGAFVLQTVESVNNAPASTVYIAQTGLSVATIAPLTNGTLAVTLNAATTGGFALRHAVAGVTAEINTVIFAQATTPVGAPVAGTLWFDNTVTNLDILLRGAAAWTRIAAANIQYAPVAPVTKANGAPLTTVDIWVDTSAAARAYPSVYAWGGAAWLIHSNTDFTTDRGMLFGDFTDQTRAALTSGAITPIAGSPNYQLYPAGMLAINMAQSSNTVRAYAAGVWRNAVINHVDGSGVFGYLAQHKAIAVSMQAAVVGNTDLRDPINVFTIIAAPNFPELADEMITLNTDRGETAFIIVDAPMRLTPAQATSWILGVGAAENGPDGLVSKNAFMGCYYPSIRTTSPAGTTITAPASHAVLRTFAYSDSVSYPWFAPAGLTRGIVTNGTGVGYITSPVPLFKPTSLSQGQRDSMYLNNLNPIANFLLEGVVVFGQKTLSPVVSALDRVNVARLVAYIRDRFDQIGRPLIFEPNDTITRDRAKGLYERFLADILAKRGITDFAVVCNLSNNTPIRIARNELYIDVAIIPTKSVEFIYIPIRLVNTGTLVK